MKRYDEEKPLEQKVEEVLFGVPFIKVPYLFNGAKLYIFQYATPEGESAGVKLVEESQTRVYAREMISNGDVADSSQFITRMMSYLGSFFSKKNMVNIMLMYSYVDEGIKISLLTPNTFSYDEIGEAKGVKAFNEVEEWFLRALAAPSSPEQTAFVKILKRSINDFAWKMDTAFETHLGHILVRNTLEKIGREIGAKAYSKESYAVLETRVHNFQAHADFWNAIRDSLLTKHRSLRYFEIKGFSDEGVPLLENIEKNYIQCTVETRLHVEKENDSGRFTQNALISFFAELFSRNTVDGKVLPKLVKTNFWKLAFSEASGQVFGEAVLRLPLE